MLVPYANAPMRNGTRLLAGHRPGHHAALFHRFQAAGVITLGKTNVPEFGYLPVTEPLSFGATVSPWSLERTAGGSSGGAGAAGVR